MSIASATELPFADASFGTVLSNCVIEHIVDNDAVLREIARVLRPGGTFATTLPSEHFADMLLGSTVLRRLRLDAAVAAYGRFFNRISYHHHVHEPAEWRRRLARRRPARRRPPVLLLGARPPRVRRLALPRRPEPDRPQADRSVGAAPVADEAVRAMDAAVLRRAAAPAGGRLPVRPVRASRSVKRAFWPLVVLIALLGLTARLWNLDFDQRQHLHPDERFWSMTSDAIDSAPGARSPRNGGRSAARLARRQRSPANPYVGMESFVYGPVRCAGTGRRRGCTTAWSTATNRPTPSRTRCDAIGVPLIDDAGAPRFDDALRGRPRRPAVRRARRHPHHRRHRLDRPAPRRPDGRRGRSRAVRVLGAGHPARALPRLRAVPRPHQRADGAGRVAHRSQRRSAASGADRRWSPAWPVALPVAVKLTGASLVAVVGSAASRCSSGTAGAATGPAVAVGVGAPSSFRFFNPAAFNGLGSRCRQPFTDDVQLAATAANRPRRRRSSGPTDPRSCSHWCGWGRSPSAQGRSSQRRRRRRVPIAARHSSDG